MNKDSCDLGRRKFAVVMSVSPILIGKLMAEIKYMGIAPLSSNNEEEFFILGRWVLLKEDLIENQG